MNITTSPLPVAISLSDSIRPSIFWSRKSGALVPSGNIVLAVLTMRYSCEWARDWAFDITRRQDNGLAPTINRRSKLATRKNRRRLTRLSASFVITPSSGSGVSITQGVGGWQNAFRVGHNP
jgi:hypothetical protein